MTSRLRLKKYQRIAIAIAGLLLAPIFWVLAQKRNPLLAPTGFDDVVFAISLSPDARTLAVARGAAEPSQRFGRIELWDTETGKLRHVIKGFDGPVQSMSFSPDGQTLVSGSIEYRTGKIQEKARSRDGEIYGEVKWWDSQTGDLKQKVTMPGEGNSSLRIAYSPDGKDLAVAESFVAWSFLSYGSFPQIPTATNPGSPFPGTPRSPMLFLNSDMKLLDAQTGSVKLKIDTNHSGGLIYSPNGRLLAVASGGDVKLWDSQTGKEERKLKGFRGRPNAIAFSPDGRVLAVASTRYSNEAAGRSIRIIGNSEIKLFDVGTWRETKKISDVGAVKSLAFSPTGKVLLIGGVMQQGEKNFAGVLLFDIPSGVTGNVTTGEDFTEAVESMAVSANGRLLALRAGSEAVKLLETKNWTVKQTLDASSVGTGIERPASRFLLSVKRVLAIAFSPDGTLAGETDQGEIKLWDPRTGEVKTQVTGDRDDPSLVAVSARGKTFAEVSNGKLQVWNAGRTAKELVPLADARAVSAVAVSADGTTLAVANGKDILLLSPAGTIAGTLGSRQSETKGLSFSDDGRILASLAEDGTIEVWDLANKRLETTLATGSEVTALRLSPNGQRLATASSTRTISVWDLKTGQVQLKLQKHEAPINALAFSPDGQLLASGGDDRTVVIWEMSSGKSKRTLKGHDQTVMALAFSPDGRLLASGSGNAAVVVWEVRSGKFTRVLK
jgi:WD40 repeat protein